MLTHVSTERPPRNHPPVTGTSTMNPWTSITALVGDLLALAAAAVTLATAIRTRPRRRRRQQR